MNIGIDLGGTWIKAVLINELGDVKHQLYQPTQDQDLGINNWKKAIAEAVETLRQKTDLTIQNIGLSAPGLPNKNNQYIETMPGRLQGLEGFDWSEFLGQKTFVINDAQAATMAEYRFGVAKGFQNMVMLTLGTGVGGGVVLNGQLYQGLLQRAGHLGHISIDNQGLNDITNTPGSLEDAIGNATIQQRSLGKYQTTYELLEDYRKKNTFATWLWLNSVRKLSIGISSIINMFSPEVVVLGGGITQADSDLFDPLNDFLDLYEWRIKQQKIPVLQAQFGDMAGAIGAAGFAQTFGTN